MGEMLADFSSGHDMFEQQSDHRFLVVRQFLQRRLRQAVERLVRRREDRKRLRRRVQTVGHFVRLEDRVGQGGEPFVLREDVEDGARGYRVDDVIDEMDHPV